MTPARFCQAQAPGRRVREPHETTAMQPPSRRTVCPRQPVTMNPGYTGAHFTKCVFTEFERAFFTQGPGRSADAGIKRSVTQSTSTARSRLHKGIPPEPRHQAGSRHADSPTCAAWRIPAWPLNKEPDAV